MDVLMHDDVFPEGTKDVDWLPRAGQSGWIVLTKDKEIRYKTDERDALRRAGVRQFVLVGGNLTSDEMAEAFVAARPAMEDLLRERAVPFIARVSREGRITRVVEL
jgi:hypothetical protein